MNERSVVIEVKDNGTVEKKLSSGGIGLSSMQTRAEEISGTLNIDYSSGYRIVLKVAI